jgi:hypothetical protein
MDIVCFDIYVYFVGLFVILSSYGGYDYILSCLIPTIYLIEKSLTYDIWIWIK